MTSTGNVRGMDVAELMPADEHARADVTLAGLLRKDPLALRLITAEHNTERLSREVHWVHSSDLLDPTPFLSDGLVLLTTGQQFRENRADTDTDTGTGTGTEQFTGYVRRLAERGIIGLGYGIGVVDDQIPPALVAACRSAELPLFEVPYATPFIAVARACAEAIAQRDYARRSWALAAQRAVSLAALRPDGLSTILAELSRKLGVWAGLFDGAGELSLQHPGAGLSTSVATELRDEARTMLQRGARAAATLQIGDSPFSLQTLGRGGHLRGVIAIGATDLDQEARAVVTAVIAMADLALEQNRRLSAARNALRAGLTQALFSGDAALVRKVSRELWGALPPAPIVVAITEEAASRSEAITELLELRAEERRGGVFFGRVDRGLIILVASADRQVISELVDRFGIRVGVSEPGGYVDFSRAVQQARIARDRGSTALSLFQDVASTGILSTFGSQARPLAVAQLQPLISHDAQQQTELMATLRAWFEQDCSNEACARALGVHRHTVRARLALTEQVLDLDLGSFATRAALWTALQLATDPAAPHSP